MSSKSVQIAFRNAIATQVFRKNNRGWENICCPFCKDRRFRGGILYTPTGGIRYKCFNGGCSFHDKPSGWEPGNTFRGRIKTLFLSINGNIDDIPIIDRIDTNNFPKSNNIKEYEPVFKFPKTSLINGSILLQEASKHYPKAQQALQYLNSRGSFFINEYPFYWSLNNPKYVILPYIYNRKIVGYLGRHITNNNVRRFIQKAPNEYMFNQELIFNNDIKRIIVMESPFDALALGGIGVRGSKLSKKQIALLKISKKDIVLVPDCKDKEGASFLSDAKKYEWGVSFPKWKNVKDVGEAIQKYGRIITAKMIVDSITKEDYNSIGRIYIED